MLNILFAVFLMLQGYCFAAGTFTLSPCPKKDINCLDKTIETFLENTCTGIPEHEIRALDPLIIPSLVFDVDEDIGLRLNFKNLNMTGMKAQRISDFQMNIETKKVVLQTKANLHVVGDLTIELMKDSKKFSGIYTADSSVLGTAQYSYDLVTNEKGVEHFTVPVGSETIEIESVTEPTVVLSSELQAALANDPVAKSRLLDTANSGELEKKAFCKIAEEGYVILVNNIRASAKILPKSVIFNDF